MASNQSCQTGLQPAAGGEEARPVLRWPGLRHPSASAYVGFPTPAPPTHSRALDAAGGVQQAAVATDSATLSTVIAALQGVDESYLRPHYKAAPSAGKPRTALQKQVAQAAPGIFSAGSATPPRPAAAAPAAAQPAQLAMAPPAVAPAPRCAADQPPAAKRARLVNVAVAADRAKAVETPAEEIAKAAAAYAAFITEFIKKHDKAAVEAASADAEQAAAAGRGGEGDQEMGEEGEDEDSDELLPSASGAAAAALLRDVRRLAEESMRICRPELQEALRAGSGGGSSASGGGGVPLDSLLRLLRLLQRLVAGGAGRLLEPADTEGSPRARKVLIAMEAAAAALHLMTVPNMPQRVYNEDAMEAVLDLLRFQLTCNIYPFHDARLRAAARPQLAAAAEEAEAAAGGAGTGKKRSAKKAKAAGAAGLRPPPAMRPLLDRAQAVLLLLADLLRVVRLPGAQLLPLLRACMVSLTVEGQKLLQEKATRLLVAAFQGYPAQWGTVLDELFAQVVPYLPGGPRPARDFPASEDARTCIQMLTAAVLQMIQACVDLPAMDCEPAALADCYKGAATCADYFWTLCFDRLPAARAQKSETDLDFRSLLHSLVRDLLSVAHQPAWPAAAFLLLRFAALLQGERGLRHPDQHVRQYCIDLLASLAAQLYADEGEAQRDAQQLQQLADAWAAADGPPGSVPASADLGEEAPRLLLLYLSDRRRAGHPSAASARTFTLCQGFAEEVTNLQKAGAAEEAMVAKLVQYRTRREELEGLGGDVELEAEQAQLLMRYVVQATLGRARSSMVQWLLECLNPASSASMTRSKAIKALGEVVQADTRVLDIASVQQAVDRALQDEAVSVREAAVSLLGRHVAANQGLALRLFNTLARASTDPGTSVRKSAIKILFDSCIKVQGFPRATDACKHVLMRSGDPEESIQDMVAKTFHSLWFTPRLEAEEGVQQERSAAERAQQLADVALAVYEAGGRAIHLPLDQGHPLVAVLRAALGVGARGDLKKEMAAGREVASALLDLFLTAEETSQAGEHAGFRHLLALHAFVVAGVELCMPPKDPAKLVRSLAPYLKVADAKGQGEAAKRRGAEALLCVLSLLDGVLGQLKHCEAGTLSELLADLHQLINRHPYVQVLAGACACLTTLAGKEESAARQLASSAAVYTAWLREPGRIAGGGAGGSPFLCRFLFILGQLCRRGADLLESTAPDEASSVLSMIECQRIFVDYCSTHQRPGGDIKVAEAALGAIGMLTIARPSIMVAKASPANQIMKAALAGGAPELLKLKALSNLIDLLRADEERMLTAQQQAEGGGSGGGDNGGGGLAAAAAANGGAGKKRGGGGGKKRGGAEAAAGGGLDSAAEQHAGLQTQNGMGDTLSQSSSILQDNWQAVLALATDTSPSAAGGAGAGGSAASPPGSAGGDLAPGTHVRRRVVELVEIVLRGGLVGPWTAVAPLMALCTDPHEEIRGRALRLLRTLCDKYPRYLDADRLCSGVVEAFNFRWALAQASGEAQSARSGWGEGAPAQALAGLSAVYAQLIQPKFQLKVDFLRGLLKRLRAGSCLVSSGAAEADLALLAFCAAVVAGLPYKRGDEPCLVVQEINSIVCRSGESVKEELKRSLYGSAQAAPTAAAAIGGAPAAAAAPPAPPSPAPSSHLVMVQCKASLALSMLLLLKEFVKGAYSVNSERIVAFATAGEKRKAEEKLVVSAAAGVPTHLDKLDLGAHRDPEKLRAQFKLFKQLMKRDSADYDHLLQQPGTGGKRGGGGRGGPEEGEGADAVVSPGAEEGDDTTPRWLDGVGRAPGGTGRGGRGRGRGGGRGGRSTGGGGRGGGSGRGTTGGRGKKRRKAAESSDEDEDGSGGGGGGGTSGEEYEPRPRTTRKRLPMT